MNFPNCHSIDVLRTPQGFVDPIVSTTQLHRVLGEKTYQRCCLHFTYTRKGGPDPDTIESFLKLDAGAARAVKKWKRKDK